MSANKKFDGQINLTINFNGNVYLQNSEGQSSNNVIQTVEASKKASFLDVLARVGGFIKRVATKVFCFIRKLLLPLI